MIRGYENKEIARELGISEQAVKEHVSALLQRFDVPNRAGLAEAGHALMITGTSTVQSSWLQYLFNEAPVMIAMLRGADHVVEIANEAFRRASGGREFLGRRIADVFPETSPEMLAIYDKVFTTGTPEIRHEMPARFLRDGQPEAGFGNFAFQPLRGEDGRVDGLMVLVIEVTEQVRAREELADLTSEHFAILDQLPSSVMVFDNEARLLRLNAAGRQLVGPSFLGTTPEDRRRMGALRHPETRTILEREEMPSVRALRGQTTDGNYLFHTPEDRDGLIHVRAAPLRRADGTIRGAVVVFTETTKPPV